MDDGNGQRIVIKVCFKARLSATETLILVQKAYDMCVTVRLHNLHAMCTEAQCSFQFVETTPPPF